MAWRVARSLDRLLAQLNAAYPNRSKVSDGAIGDAAHASRTSDHNPWVLDGSMGIVTARDYTHHPASGMDCEKLYQALVASRDPRIKYIIWNRTITSGSGQTQPWVRRPYSGTNAHTQHLHLSVQPTKVLYDDSRDWAVAGGGSEPAKADPNDDYLTLGDSGPAVVALQETLNRWYPRLPQLTTDGDFGPATLARVKYYQAAAGLTADGEVGPGTRKGLGLKPPAEYVVTPAPEVPTPPPTPPREPQINPNGGIAQFYNALSQGEKDRLGALLEDEASLGDGYVARYAGGQIFYKEGLRAHYVWGAIFDVWGQQGWEHGPLGYPVTNEFVVRLLDGDGVLRDKAISVFEHGSIIFDVETGSTAVFL